MRRAITSATALAAAIVLLTGASATGRATKIVEVGDDFFNPLAMTIRQNNTIDFIWVGEGVHKVSPSEDSPGKYFDSGASSETGFVYSHQFRKPGRYEILCTLHDEMRMNLRVKRRR